MEIHKAERARSSYEYQTLVCGYGLIALTAVVPPFRFERSLALPLPPAHWGLLYSSSLLNTAKPMCHP